MATLLHQSTKFALYLIPSISTKKKKKYKHAGIIKSRGQICVNKIRPIDYTFTK